MKHLLTGMTTMILIVLSFATYANNLVISNVSLTIQNVGSNFTLINFDVGWDNSWRVSTGPSNYDAVWLFAKYRLKTSNVWNHATLHYADGTGSGDGHTEPAGSNISSSNDNASGGAYGAFIYATANFSQGSVSYTNIDLRWDYGVDGLSDGDSVEICVFGIEMVNIPQSSFFIGDGTSTRGQFEAGTSSAAYQVTSEGAITLGGGGVGSIGNNNNNGMLSNDDFNDATSRTLAASFPKGFDSFFIMKYELSQKQYVDFMNKLTRTQQSGRMLADAAGEFMHNSDSRTTPANRNGIKIIDNASGSIPRTYGNDLDNDDIEGESIDGQNIACNLISVPDMMAYLDWSGLRPMTEFEYEKVCRGTLAAVAGEYAWGSTAITGATSISNSGANNEIAGNTAAFCTYNNSGSVQGPLRVGQFAEASTTRVNAGAGYYGVLDLSGNLYEYVVIVGTSSGRAFTGTHGDGELDANGDRTNSDWASATTTLGIGLRGSSWSNTIINGVLETSNRRFINSTDGITRRANRGIRGVRTAP